MNKGFLIFCCSILLFLTNCSLLSSDAEQPQKDNGESGEEILSLSVPNDFSYRTAETIDLSLRFLANDNSPLKYIRFYITTDSTLESTLFSAASDNRGTFSGTITVPKYLDTLYVNTQYVGLPLITPIILNKNSISLTIGGITNREVSPMLDPSINRSITDYVYLGSWNSSGVPSYLMETSDVISSQLLQSINASLPEGKPVPTYHPDYLSNDAATDIALNDSAEIWVTFVHEGAGWKNSLGYFVYDKDNPPQTTADIDSVIVLFPNVSYQGSGGGLHSGDKIYLGKFGPNQVVSWVLVAQGWKSTNYISGNYSVTSLTELNPEPDPSLKQHMVALFDGERDLLLLGFEDIQRTASSCDNDFNDAVFYAQVSPMTSIDTSLYKPIDISTDADNDDISDLYDDYPNDPTRAFDNYYPSINTFGTLMFEDRWPKKGDYDMNDLILDYQYHYVLNATGGIKDINGKYIIRAIGASYKNGFAVQLNNSPAHIASVTGNRIFHNDISFNGNGTEAGQSKSNIIICDNTRALFSNSTTYINTDPNEAWKEPETLSVAILFNTPPSLSTTGPLPFNPYMIVNRDRSKEVHLPDYPNTDLANTELFLTFADDTRPSLGRYYKTSDNLPWALDLTNSIPYPQEEIQITRTFLYFAQWAESGGTQYEDWYLPEEGYRNVNKLYPEQ